MEALQNILLILVQAVIVAVIPILSKFLIDMLVAKSGQLNEQANSEYIKNIIDNVTNIITTSVLFVSQTYVDNLKKEGKFDLDEQKIALEMACARIMELIDEESKDVLTAIFGDIGLWIHTMIEASVNVNKE